jgi:hypothetical protein
VICLVLKKGIPLIVPNTHYADSKALKLQSVSPLYNAQQGVLDVADTRGGLGPRFRNHTTLSNTHNESQAVKGRTHIGEVEPHRSGDP